MFKYRDILTEGTAEVHIKGASDAVSFFVVQVHTYLYPVVLSTTQTNTAGSSINGTNIGLVQFTNGSAVYKFFIVSNPSFKIDTLISVLLYDKNGKLAFTCHLFFVWN